MTLTEYDICVKRDEGVAVLCGVDEAGRGPLAGPVYAAAVILPDNAALDGLDDSKKLSEKKRDLLFDSIIEQADRWCVASATVEEIESINILAASMLAMRRAVEGLCAAPGLVLVDGGFPPKTGFLERCVVKGDGLSACIAAASILAKVSRDRHMLELSEKYPAYRFEKHKGYGTALHYDMLGRYGACPAHRQSFLKKWREKGRHER